MSYTRNREIVSLRAKIRYVSGGPHLRLGPGKADTRCSIFRFAGGDRQFSTKWGGNEKKENVYFLSFGTSRFP